MARRSTREDLTRFDLAIKKLLAVQLPHPALGRRMTDAIRGLREIRDRMEEILEDGAPGKQAKVADVEHEDHVAGVGPPPATGPRFTPRTYTPEEIAALRPKRLTDEEAAKPRLADQELDELRRTIKNRRRRGVDLAKKKGASRGDDD